MIAILVCLSYWGQASRHALSQRPEKCDPEIVRRIVAAFTRVNTFLHMLEKGPTTPEDKAEALRYAYELLLLFERYGPCPTAIAEIILMEKDSVWDFLWPFYDAFPVDYTKFRLSYLELLERGDERLKDHLPKLRKEFVPDFKYDGKFLEHYKIARKPFPSWYVERAFTCSPHDLRHNTTLPDNLLSVFHAKSLAARLFCYLEEDDEFLKHRADDLDWSIHVIETYGVRLNFDRATPEDAELARTQLKWLWATGKWWARRYVVEVLEISPQLAYDGVIEELTKERHPYVGPRIDELKLVQLLTTYLEAKKSKN